MNKREEEVKKDALGVESEAEEIQLKYVKTVGEGLEDQDEVEPLKDLDEYYKAFRRKNRTSLVAYYADKVIDSAQGKSDARQLDPLSKLMTKLLPDRKVTEINSKKGMKQLLDELENE